MKQNKNPNSSKQNQLNDLLDLACQHGFLEDLKDLLTGSERRLHADITHKNHTPFKIAALSKQMPVIHYLIFDYQIEKDLVLMDFLAEHPNINALFAKRELHQKLKETLPINSVSEKPKSKI